MFTLLVSLISLISAIEPALSPAMAALPVCSGNQVMDPNSGTCGDPTIEPDTPTEVPPTAVPSPTESPTDVPTDTLTDTPTITPRVASTANILVSKFTCPEGYSRIAQNANPHTDCTQPTDGVTFTLSVSTVLGTLQSNTGDSIPGAVSFADITPGTVTLTEILTPATSATFHICAIPYSLGLIQDGETFTGPIAAGETITCSWYNVPAPTPTVASTGTPMATATATATTETGSPTATSSGGTPTAMAPVTGTPGNGTPTTTDGDLVVHKWMCPAGYNELLPGANPVVDCPTMKDGITFKLTDDAGVLPVIQTNTGDSIPGAVHFGGTAAGNYHLTETIPANVDRVFVPSCQIVNGATTTSLPIVVSGAIALVVHGGDQIVCNWFNVPKAGSGDLTIQKQICIGGTYTGGTDCSPQTTGVNFNLAIKTGTTFVPVTGGTTNALGVLPFSGLAPGTYQITEVGGTPCYVTATQLDANNAAVSVLNSDGTVEVTNGKETVVTVFNCRGRGDITVYKWVCPPGYDYTRPGANPPIDCPTAMNGVNFHLTDNAGVQYPLQTMTGDSMNGAVFFGGTVSGNYTLTEDVPAGIQQEFVWNCTGASTSWVNPMPLSVGNKLGITVANYDKIVCNWFNVPKPTPQTGDLTIHKQLCTGTVFTSPVDCDTFEGGATFQIQVWNGTAWVPVTTATTNNAGVIALSGLAPGTYLVKESGGNPCKATATQLDVNSKPVDVLNAKDGTVPVTNGKETVVTVFNCRVPNTTPVPVKTPSKYPNTGVDSSGVAPSSSRAQDTQVIEPDSSTPTAAPASPAATVPCPKLTGADGVTTTPVATPEAGQECARGAVPASISIPSIKVEATAEVKEILDGVMQEPSDEKIVTWYKETARLGENGNVVIAGHLNWWGFPEAVFFNLSSLKAGDLIQVSDGHGGTFTYVVTTVRQMPNDGNPDTITRGTGAETLTLITCGGEWDPAASEYNSRTVVQAVRQTIKPNP
ncbi:MAG: SpaA isopeptide-forming pilin-related protein [Thermomicrobiales bacterium]